MAFVPGARLGPYEIRGTLGAGGMGTVYRAHDPRLARDIALKILPENVARDAESLARFTREARAVAALNHPHIVTIHSTEDVDGLQFITMELIEGRTLDQLISVNGVSLAQFFNASIAIAEALAAAHQKQITHRDLKPGNVMVTESGLVKVLDFGLARGGAEPNPADELTLMTQAGMVLGTAPYMSPEQVEARAVDPRSDIFSLGIVMYEMATGSRPFKGETPTSLMLSILKDHPSSISEIRRDVPEGVAQLIGRCLEKNPRDRVQTMQEILIELKAHRRAWESGVSSKPRTAALRMAASEESRFRIAVLPFQSRSSNTDAEALADGLTDDITAGLARFPYLRVVSRPDAEAAKGKAADARAAALVGARYLLEGAVRTAGAMTRVNVRLIDVETGSHLWADTFDRQLTMANVFDVQDDLTNRIVATVADSAGVLVRSMAASIRERKADELSLDELVLRYYAYLDTIRPDEHATLRAALERGLEMQASHALAWACLAGLYEHEHSLELNVRPDTDAQSRARTAARRSVELDPTCQEGWRQIAVRCHFERDLSGLRVAAEQTIQLNPLSTTAAYMGLLFGYAGDWEQALSLTQRAIELNPHHLKALHLVVCLDHYRRGEYQDALTQAKRANLPNHVGTLILSAAAAGRLQRVTEARTAFDGLRRHHPACVDPEKAVSILGVWVWDGSIVQDVIQGFVRAKALDATPGTQTTSSGAHRTPLKTRASIAVLPFTDMSAAKDQDWFCDGVAEEILNALSQLKDLRVAARASAFSFRGKGDDLKTIGDKLQVATVLDGSVRRSGDQLRITVRLSDVTNGYQLWSERYDRSLSGIFDVQEEIAKAVAARLSPSDDSAAQPHVVRHTENQEAYHLYLRGRHLWYSRSKGSLQRARELFEEASRKDPNYVLPWVGLADLFAIQSLYGFEREEYANPRAVEAVNRALAINDRVGDAHRARGFSLLWCADYAPKLSAAAFERSIALDPMSGLSHIWLGWATWPGRDAIALASARRAQELDPLNPYIHSLAGAIHDAYGRTEEGLRDFDKAFELDPNYLVGLYLGGGAYSRIGRHDEALGLFAKGVELSGRAAFYLSYYAWALARAGRVEEARAALAELESRATSEYVQHLHRAVVYSALGEMDRAFELLELGVRDHNGWIGCPRMPMFENFRKDPRYAEHLRRIGHPDAEWASATV